MIADESVAEFISLAGASDEEARGYLEMAGGNLQQAISLFFEMGGSAAAPAATPAPRPPSPVDYNEDVAAEVRAAAIAAGIDAGPSGVPDEAMEEVRAPMPSYQDQIIDPEHEQRRMEEAMAADSAAMSADVL